MKNYLIIIVVSLCFITTSKADDIEDFQIGKMNVRDSLLDYFDRKLIITDLNSKYTFFYKNNTYAIVTAGNSNNYDLKIDTELYDDIAITIKPDDKNFIIYALSGRIFCSNDINYCKSKKKRN